MSEHHQPASLNLQMTPKAARDILDYLETQDAILAHESKWPTKEEEDAALNLRTGAYFILKALGIPHNHIKWTAEER